MATLRDVNGADYTPPTAVAGAPAAAVSLFNTSLTTVDGSIILLSTFDGASFDTNVWTAAGTVPPTQDGLGNALINPGVGASASSSLTTVPTFGPSGYEIIAGFFKVETGSMATGNHRVLVGLDTQPGSWTALNPVQDGYVLEITPAGQLRFAVYANGAVSGTPTVLTYPVNDGNTHLGVIHYRPGIAAVAIDNIFTYLATSTAQPAVQTLPFRVASINGVGGATGTPTFTAALSGLVDYSRPTNSNSDGVYAFRRQTVGARGDAVVSLMDGNKTSYSASVSGLVGVAGDILIINGSATKTVRVTRMSFGGTATAAADMDVTLIKRSSANSAGTGVAATPHDSANAAATAVVQSYTAAPTPGAAVGTPVRSAKSFIATATTAPFIQNWDFGNGPKQGVVLRGVAQGLAMNVSATQIGALYDLDLEWTEE